MQRRMILGVVGVLGFILLISILVIVGLQRQQLPRAPITTNARPSPTLSREVPPPPTSSPQTTVILTPTPPAAPTDVPSPTPMATMTPLSVANATPTVGIVQGVLPSKIQPLRITASNQADQSVDSLGNITTFVASNAVDGDYETAWRVPGDGRGQYLLLEFAQPMIVSEIRIVPGYAKIDPRDNTNRFYQNRRVVRVRIETSDGIPIEATFVDAPIAQPIPLNGVTTNTIRVIIIETTDPGAVNGRDFTPISEIEVYGVTP